MSSLASLLILATLGGGGDTVCEKTALIAYRAAQNEVLEDAMISYANCLNITNAALREACIEEVFEAYEEGLEETADILEARLEVCDDLEEFAYDPPIRAEDFDDPVPNPLWPMVPGMSWRYESSGGDVFEVVEVEVLGEDETREIMGIECITVHDVVTEFEDGPEGEGVVIEDTFDYYAVDNAGNVWYFGEMSFELEDGFIVAMSGSWIAGVDGAKPGIVMWADPGAADPPTYRQEWWLDEAEDIGRVVATDVTVEVPYTPAEGVFMHCLETEDYTPLEPGSIEHKFYAPGVGFIKEMKIDSDEEVALVEFHDPR